LYCRKVTLAAKKSELLGKKTKADKPTCGTGNNPGKKYSFNKYIFSAPSVLDMIPILVSSHLIITNPEI
jgi:hypothetical protein